MARVNNLSNFLTDVASAIKTKKGSETNIPAANFDTEILALPSQGVYEQRVLNISANGTQTITPSSGYDAIDELELTIAVPEKQLQSKTYNFTQNTNIQLLPDSGYDGFDTVTLNINVPSSQINNQDKTITQNGTYTADSGYTGLGEVTVNVPSLDTSDATATVNDITEGKTAYVNGNKITGTYIEDPNKLYFFGSVSEMEQSTKIQNGVQSIVLTEILNEINTASIFDELVFPEQIVMRTPITSSFSTSFRRTDNNSRVTASGNRTQFSFISSSYIKYTSTNGITYNRTTFTIPENFGTITGDTVKFVTSFKYDNTGGFYDEVSKFLRTKSYQSDLYLKENDDFTLIEAQKNKLLDLSKLYYHDTDVTYYKLSNIFDTSHIKDVTSMFDSCTNLVTCDLSNLDFSNITSLATMFWGCINLTTIVFPSTIDTSKVTTMAELFGSHGRFCPKLDDNSLNSILLMCANATSYTGTKTLRYLGITSAEATTCQSLSNYQAFVNAGWTTGY